MAWNAWLNASDSASASLCCASSADSGTTFGRSVKKAASGYSAKGGAVGGGCSGLGQYYVIKQPNIM